ncbi:MAG: sulfatase-like hydrolase/transferase, partial [Pseudomonadota bacterium]|nr:sulfatase-like hydrolase/transferase [Pseudomonadota bacterium]
MKRTFAHRDAPGKFGRRRFLGGAAAAAGVTALLPHLAGATSDTLRTGSRTRSVAAGQRYNILLITTDQESFAYPTVPGFELPNRQRIAERGVSFQRHYTASNMCTAARSVLFTGQHVQRTGMFDNSNYPYTPDFPAGTKTLGHALGDLGYRV